MSGCEKSPLVSAFAGCVGGIAAAFATCPLEVIKTRLQSSLVTSLPDTTNTTNTKPPGTLSLGLHIVRTEGFRALYKGLAANVVGVAGSRFVYFLFYAEVTKDFITRTHISKDSSLVVISAAACAGAATQTITAPIWFIKTRLQLSSQQGYTTWQCFQNAYLAEGFRGFFRGLSASYFGVAETVIKFAVYEKLKKYLREHHDWFDHLPHDENEPNYTIDFATAGALSKIVATVTCYPHEVARTRLRQEEHGGPRKYRHFFQTLGVVYREEGLRVGLYGGLGTQLVRQVPNSAIMFMVYETIVNLCEGEE